MKKSFSVLLVVVLTALSFPQGNPARYYNNTLFSFTSPGAMKYGLYGYDNPAVLGTLTQPDLFLTWTNQNGNWNDTRRIGVFAAAPTLGFSMNQEYLFGSKINDYGFSFGTESRSNSVGFGYHWSTGDKAAFGRVNYWTLGTLTRPFKYLSVGAVALLPEQGDAEAVVEVAGRPLGNEKVSLFADYLYKKNSIDADNIWSAGVAVEALPGIRVTGRYFENKNFTVGVQLEFGHFGISSQSYFDKDSKYGYNSYGVRVGAYDRNVVRNFLPQNSYVTMNMINGVKYNKFRLFDNSSTLLEIIDNIDAAKVDPTVKGIYLNLSGMYVNKTMLWEIREKLKDFKGTGKEVVVFMDMGGLNEYHFASVADKIYMDPMALVTFEGYMLGRSYLKGTLAKLGLGYDEWRFFKYKSAAETLSRDKMSDADREQRQAIVDDWYDIAKSEITQSRSITGEKFDDLVNNKFIVTAKEALEMNLIDGIARWDSVESALKKDDNKLVGKNALVRNKMPEDNRWGDKPKVAVIYALGACAMDEGIKARTLIKDVNKAVEDDDVKAIVFRVDSPGGDAYASDIIAEGLKKAKGKKPVIVTQGAVAGSGGYWLSMYGDTIIATPGTITGSIGVIGGFLYNKGLLDSAGITVDHVKKGDHADLGFGFVIPLLNMPIPERNMRSEEKEKVATMIKGMYKEFVTKVSVGRNRSYDEIENVAQGRVFSGQDGLNNGLVDVLGGLETAINLAADKAGLKKDEYDIVSYPDAGLFDISQFMPSLISTKQITDNPTFQSVKVRLDNNGKPLLMMPIDLGIE
ncbi:MAG: signal peptide peptidase SppA [Ignavibacteriaceae bacterium]|nr:signal peptide peptidase SppA [Ignavibacteriaceae bacterium]